MDAIELSPRGYKIPWKKVVKIAYIYKIFETLPYLFSVFLHSRTYPSKLIEHNILSELKGFFHDIRNTNFI